MGLSVVAQIFFWADSIVSEKHNGLFDQDQGLGNNPDIATHRSLRHENIRLPNSAMIIFNFQEINK
jgi:hypothetical protein